ncbi:MAG: hypothetical protein JJE47_17420, partial [Acidimicrobiia bacterium]|nr:hypothetical protein [Acidimicrobiia bacterium]
MNRGRAQEYTAVTRLITVLAILALIVSACGGTTTEASGDGTTTTEVAGDPVRLVYASFAVEDSPHSQAFAWMADEMNKRTNGRVTIEPFYAGALCAFADIFDCIKDGRADFGLFLPVQQPSFFPYSSVGSVLFVSRDTQAHSEAFSEMAKTNDQFKAEWAAQGMAPLWFASIGPAILGANEPVENIDWLKNKSIRA